MQATNGQIVNAIPSLQQLAKSPVSFTIANRILSALSHCNTINEQIRQHTVQRQEVLNKEHEENEEVVTAELEKEINELMQQNTILDVLPIPLSGLDHLRISTEEFIKIHWLMKE